MPFKSKSQRKFMYAKHPKIAKEFESETHGVSLPEKVKKDNYKKASRKVRRMK